MGELLIYLMCVIAGCFFSVMMFTILENASEGFRKVVDAYYKGVPKGSRNAITFVVAVLALFLVYLYVPIGATRAGILAGAIIGVPVYFKSGVTMNKTFNMGPKYEKRSKAERKAAKAQAKEEKMAAKAIKSQPKSNRPKELKKNTK